MAKSLKIGVLMPRSGPAGIWAPSCEASALLAAAEINAAGGVAGRPIELVMVDAGSTDRSAANAAYDAVSVDDVDAIVAMVTSSARAGPKPSGPIYPSSTRRNSKAQSSIPKSSRLAKPQRSFCIPVFIG